MMLTDVGLPPTTMGELAVEHYDISTENPQMSAHEALVKSAKFAKKGLFLCLHLTWVNQNTLTFKMPYTYYLLETKMLRFSVVAVVNVTIFGHVCSNLKTEFVTPELLYTMFSFASFEKRGCKLLRVHLPKLYYCTLTADFSIH